MKQLVFIVTIIFFGTTGNAQQSIISNSVDVRKNLQIPRVTAFPSLPKPGSIVYKYTGSDSGIYMRRYTDATWIKLYPISSGSTYTAGNGIKALGANSLQSGVIRLADSLTGNYVLNSNNLNFDIRGFGYKSFTHGQYGGGTESRGLLVTPFGTTLIAAESDVSINARIDISSSLPYVLIRARNAPVALPNRQLAFYLYPDSIKIQSEAATGLIGYQMRVPTNSGTKYLMLGIDSTSGGMVAVRNVGGTVEGISGVNTQTGTTYTLLAADLNEVIEFTNSSPITVTLPNGLADNFSATIVRKGTGLVTINAAGTLQSDGNTIETQNHAAFVYHKSGNVWTASGSLGSPSSGGDMLSANNLNDVASIATARNNLLPSKTGKALQVLRVNSGETDYEVATIPNFTTLNRFDEWNQATFYNPNATVIDPFVGTAVSSGTNNTAIPTQAIDGLHLGGVFLRSSTTANGGYRYQTNSLSSNYFGQKAQKFVCKLLWRATTGVTVRLGYGDQTTSADAVDGAYFEIVGTTASAKTANNSVRTTNATTQTIAVDTWYRFEIDVNADGTSVQFRLYNDTNDNLLMDVTNTANIPITSARAFGAGLVATESSTTALDMIVLSMMGFGTPNANNRFNQ